MQNNNYPSPTISPTIYDTSQSTLSTSTTSPWSIPKSIIDREYKTLYLSEGQSLPYINTAVRGDLYYHVHLSGVTVIGLAPSHPIIRDELEVINFHWKKVGEGGNQLQLQGKRKVGAPTFSPDDTFCVIQCRNGEEFHIKPYIRGRLAEMNSSYQSQPVPVDPNQQQQQQQQQKGKHGKGNHSNQNKNKGNRTNNNNNNNDNNNNQSDSTTTTTTTTTVTTTTTTVTTTETTISTPLDSTTTAPPPPQPQQVYTPELLERYKLLHQDPTLRGYLCLFLIQPEQMQLMLRLFLSQRDFTELISQRQLFNTHQKQDPSLNFEHLHFPLITKALAIPKPMFVINHQGGRPLLVFKKGEFKIKNGLYNDLYQSLSFTPKTTVSTTTDPTMITNVMADTEYQQMDDCQNVSGTEMGQGTDGK